MKKNALLILTLSLTLGLRAQDYAPRIPTMDDYCKQFSSSKDWTFSCVTALQVDTNLQVDAMLFRVETNEQWENLLTQFHIKPQQLWNHEDQKLHMGWSRTWRRDLKKDAFKKTPGEHACLLFLSPATATALLLFPQSTADEVRLLTFFLTKYKNQEPMRIKRLEMKYNPHSREFYSPWLPPIIAWGEYMQNMLWPPTF